jgi:hypothetical protein
MKLRLAIMAFLFAVAIALAAIQPARANPLHKPGQPPPCCYSLSEAENVALAEQFRTVRIYRR